MKPPYLRRPEGGELSAGGCAALGGISVELAPDSCGRGRVSFERDRPEVEGQECHRVRVVR